MPKQPVGAFTSLTLPGRTLSILNLGPGRSAAILAYRSANPAAELARGPSQALSERYGDLGWVVPDLLAQLRRSESDHFDSGSQIYLSR